MRSSKKRRTDNISLTRERNAIGYQLSNGVFITCGWTVLPITRKLTKIVQYETRMAKPHLDRFKINNNEGTKYYNDKRTPFIKFNANETGEVYYPNGQVAIKVYKPENRQYNMYLVYSPGGIDSRRVYVESQLIAVFDSLGNGVVFNEHYHTRLSYNQIGGICIDNARSLPFAWMWQQNEIMAEPITIDEEPGALELESAYKRLTAAGGAKKEEPPISPMEQSQRTNELMKSGWKNKGPGSLNNKRGDTSRVDVLNPIKRICMKLNEYLSLRIIDRKNVNLQYFSGTKNIRIELGTELNLDNQLESCLVESSQWKKEMLRCYRYEGLCFEKLEKSTSLQELATEYERSKKIARSRDARLTKYQPAVDVQLKSIRKPLECI